MRNLIIPALCAIALFGMSFQANAATVSEPEELSAAQILLDEASRVNIDTMYDGNVYTSWSGE